MLVDTNHHVFVRAITVQGDDSQCPEPELHNGFKIETEFSPNGIPRQITYTANSKRVDQFAVPGAEIRLTKDGQVEKLRGTYIENFGARQYTFQSGGQANVSARHVGNVTVATGESYTDGSGRIIVEKGHYIVKMKTLFKSDQFYAKLKSDQFSIRLPTSEKSLPVDQIPNFFGYAIQYGNVGCSRYALNDAIAVVLPDATPFLFKSQEDVFKFCKHDDSLDLWKDRKDKEKFRWSSTALEESEIFQQNVFNENSYRLTNQAIEHTIFELSGGNLSLQPISSEELAAIGSRSLLEIEKTSHVVLAGGAHWNMLYSNPSRKFNLERGWYWLDHRINVDFQKVHQIDEEFVEQKIDEEYVWQVVAKPSHNVVFSEIVNTMYGKHAKHASHFTGQLSLSQINEYISKRHSDENIHGFLDESKKAIPYVTDEEVPLGAVWLRLGLRNSFQ